MEDLFSVQGKGIAITGGGGVLLAELAGNLAARGAKVCILDIRPPEALCEEIRSRGGFAKAIACDVLDKPQIDRALAEVQEQIGQVDVLINGAGGNRKDATCGPDKTFFDLPPEAIRGVFDLNCMGTVFCSQAFGRHMAQRKRGNIVNISSMNAFRPLTNIAAYSSAKAAVSNFTQWLAVYMAQNHSPEIRVNAIAPGFFLTQQNAYLLTDAKTEGLTARGAQVIAHTPMGRFGKPADLLGTLLWLISDASQFVTGVVVPVDGGFCAYSGV